jgi:hypothetical protein
MIVEIALGIALFYAVLGFVVVFWRAVLWVVLAVVVFYANVFVYAIRQDMKADAHAKSEPPLALWCRGTADNLWVDCAPTEKTGGGTKVP